MRCFQLRSPPRPPRPKGASRAPWSEALPATMRAIMGSLVPRRGVWSAGTTRTNGHEPTALRPSTIARAELIIRPAAIGYQIRRMGGVPGYRPLSAGGWVGASRGPVPRAWSPPISCVDRLRDPAHLPAAPRFAPSPRERLGHRCRWASCSRSSDSPARGRDIGLTVLSPPALVRPLSDERKPRGSVSCLSSTQPRARADFAM